MFHLLSYIFLFSYVFVISCAGKKKKPEEGYSGKIVKSVESNTIGGKTGKVKTKVTGSTTTNNGTTKGKLCNEIDTKVQPTPLTSRGVENSKLEKKTKQLSVPKKTTVKNEDVGGNGVKSTYNNCSIAAPTQINIFDPCDDPAADKLILEATQNTLMEELKDGDDTLKNVYSLPIDKDQSLKVVEKVIMAKKTSANS